MSNGRRRRGWGGRESCGGGEASGGGEGVDLGGGFVGAEAGDAREAEGEAAVVAFAGLDSVEGDFEHDVGHDEAAAAEVFERVFEKVLGEGGDLGVGEAGVGFADGEEAIGGVVADGEGVVTKHAAALAVALLDSDDHDVKGGIGFFEFEPGEAAAAGGVGASGVLGHEALVAAGAGGEEGGFDVGGGRGGGEGSELKTLNDE